MAKPMKAALPFSVALILLTASIAAEQLVVPTSVRLRVKGVGGKPLTIQSSGNLRDWSPLVEFPLFSGSEVVLDGQAGSLSQRFYRAVAP